MENPASSAREVREEACNPGKAEGPRGQKRQRSRVRRQKEQRRNQVRSSSSLSPLLPISCPPHAQPSSRDDCAALAVLSSTMPTKIPRRRSRRAATIAGATTSVSSWTSAPRSVPLHRRNDWRGAGAAATPTRVTLSARPKPNRPRRRPRRY